MTVSRFQCSSVQRLAPLLAADPAAPYRGHRARLGPAVFDGWAAARGGHLLCGATGAFEAVTGALGWTDLAWDTAMLGFAAGRIEVLAVGGEYNEARRTASLLLATALQEIRCRHTVCRVDASSLALAHALSENGFELVDGIQTFALALEPEKVALPGDCRLAQTSDIDTIGGIARSSFVFDRFHNDVTVGTGAADHLHEVWARNSVAGTAADAVLVATSDGKIDGFVTVKLDRQAAAGLGIPIATIPLVATAKEARGKGAARRATQAAIAWCQAQGVRLLEVGTQLSNVPAARLYQSAGFRTSAISMTYRKWID